MKRLFELVNKNFLKARLDFLGGKQTRRLPLITVSREKGSGGRIIAYMVAKKLGKSWKVFHKEIVDEIAKEIRLEKKLVNEVDEKKVPLIDAVIGNFFGKSYLNLSSYYRHLVKILSTIGHRGYAIIIGRGADYLFPQALKVRIICDMKQRIKWLMEFEKISEKEAKKRIEQSDKERMEFVRTLYGHDSRKAHHYDLVIRTGPNLPVEDASDLIVRLAKRRFKM